MDRIELTGIEFPCIIGLHPWERRRPQPLAAALSLSLPLDAAAAGDLSASIDYQGVLADLRFIAECGRFELLESLGVAVARYLLRPPGPGEARAAAQSLRLTLRKPQALPQRAVPAVVIERSADEAAPESVADEGGVRAERLLTTPNVAVERLCLPPGHAVGLPPRRVAQLVGGVLVAGEHALAARAGQLPTDTHLRAGPQGATLLCLQGSD